MNTRKFHEIWIEQCDAAHEIKRRYGVKAAFDYLVAEKLFNFVEAATARPNSRRSCRGLLATFENSLPREEIRSHLARIARERLNMLPSTTTRRRIRRG